MVKSAANKEVRCADSVKQAATSTQEVAPHNFIWDCQAQSSPPLTLFITKHYSDSHTNPWRHVSSELTAGLKCGNGDWRRMGICLALRLLMINTAVYLEGAQRV